MRSQEYWSFFLIGCGLDSSLLVIRRLDDWFIIDLERYMHKLHRDYLWDLTNPLSTLTHHSTSRLITASVPKNFI